MWQEIFLSSIAVRLCPIDSYLERFRQYYTLGKEVLLSLNANITDLYGLVMVLVFIVARFKVTKVALALPGL